jgi:hypothetical protein
MNCSLFHFLALTPSRSVAYYVFVSTFEHRNVRRYNTTPCSYGVNEQLDCKVFFSRAREYRTFCFAKNNKRAVVNSVLYSEKGNLGSSYDFTGKQCIFHELSNMSHVFPLLSLQQVASVQCAKGRVCHANHLGEA